MRENIDRLANFYADLKNAQNPDADMLKTRKEKLRRNHNSISERNWKRMQENMKKFDEYGICEMFRQITNTTVVIQDDRLKHYGGIDKAKYEFDKHYKKCSLIFDQSEHKITVSLPFNNGLNIHAFERDEQILRNRVDFNNKTNEEIRTEIETRVFEQIAALQGYTRVNFDEIN